jgi:peptidoglycan DL-endopeptidase CwlO
VQHPGRALLRTAATAAVAVLVVTIPMTSATADPSTPSASTVRAARAHAQSVAAQVGVMQAQLAAAQAKLQALGQAVDAAGEAYNGAMYKLAQAQKVADAASAAAASAQAQVESAQVDLGRVASAAYRGDGLGLGLSAVLAADSPDSMIEALGTMSVIAHRQDDVVDRLKAAKVVASVLDKRAADALAAVTAAADAAKAAKAAVQQKAAEQAAQVGAINTQVAALTKALAAARARSTQLAAARAAGLARARRAAELAARQRASHGGSTGGHQFGGSLATSAGARKAIAYARAQLGKPYEWAADGPATFDCSGLTMRAWQAGGISLPHWSVAQWQVSTPVSWSNARPGDLVFFAFDLNDFSSIHHVALYIGNGQMIEAPYTGADVRISSVDRPDLFGFARP